jgi:hypothetical protein
MEGVSSTLKLQVVSEDSARTIILGRFLDSYQCVVKVWPRVRVLDQITQVRTAKLPQQQPAKHVQAMLGIHTGLVVCMIVPTLPESRSWSVYSELVQCRC